MEDTKRLAKVRAFLEERGWKYKYTEEDGCGSIDFDYGGRQEELTGDYETEILEIMKDWH